MRAMIDDNLVIAHRQRGLTPDNPMIKGTSQNPDVYFQGREVSNKYYNALFLLLPLLITCPSIVQIWINLQI